MLVKSDILICVFVVRIKVCSEFCPTTALGQKFLVPRTSLSGLPNTDVRDTYALVKTCVPEHCLEYALVYFCSQPGH